ncbi:MAG: hypothetical protein ACI9Y7_000718 [Dokdonia sp.]|jgi:hypothetical protein
MEAILVKSVMIYSGSDLLLQFLFLHTKNFFNTKGEGILHSNLYEAHIVDVRNFSLHILIIIIKHI